MNTEVLFDQGNKISLKNERELFDSLECGATLFHDIQNYIHSLKLKILVILKFFLRKITYIFIIHLIVVVHWQPLRFQSISNLNKISDQSDGISNDLNLIKFK